MVHALSFDDDGGAHPVRSLIANQRRRFRTEVRPAAERRVPSRARPVGRCLSGGSADVQGDRRRRHPERAFRGRHPLLGPLFSPFIVVVVERRFKNGNEMVRGGQRSGADPGTDHADDEEEAGRAEASRHDGAAAEGRAGAEQAEARGEHWQR